MMTKTLGSSPSAELRAIKWFTLMHAVGLVLFAALIGGLLWYLNRVDLDQQRQALYRDIEWAQQSIRLKLRDNQDEIVVASADWALSEQLDGVRGKTRDFLSANPDVLYVGRLDGDRRILWLLPARGLVAVSHRAPGQRVDDPAGYGAFSDALQSRRPSYSSPYVGHDNELMVELHVPIEHDGRIAGTIAVGYSLSRMLTTMLAPEVRERYHLSIVDQGGNILVSSSPRTVHAIEESYELPLDPPGRGIRLRAFVFDTRPRILERSLLVAVVGLSIAALVSLAMLWRHARRRIVAEAERDRLFRLSQDLMCVLDARGRFLRVNPAFEAMFGGATFDGGLIELAHPDDRSRIRTALGLDSAPAQASVAFEARFPGVQGWRWLNWSMRSDPDRTSSTWYAVAHDVTERKSAETALAAETAFRRAMEDSMLTGMRAFDMRGEIIFVNRAFCDMVGFSAQELIGARPPYPYWPPEEYELQQANLDMILAGEAPPSGIEVSVQRKDASLFDARMYVSPLIDREGAQTGWMTSITDITEPRRAREQLAAAHERFTTVLDELDAAVLVLPERAADASDPVPLVPLFTNRTCQRLFSDPAELARLLREADNAPADNAPREIQLAASARWFDLRPRNIRWVDGRPVRLLVVTEVTRRHESEALQREQDEKLQRTSRLVTMGEMASSLAHELNQPLTAIANYCMGLSARVRTRIAAGAPADGAEVLELLGKTSAQAERAGMVIRRIREFVKRSEPERRACEIGAIVADVVGLAEIDAQRLGLRIEVTIDPQVATVHADPILIGQVLLNLSKNGIDAMRSTETRSLALAVRQSGDAVEFSVTDAGSGLSAITRGRLFEPFFTTKDEGMGMGLNICRSIVESHGGRLWVDENEGPGCTFRFTLPAGHAAPAERAA